MDGVLVIFTLAAAVFGVFYLHYTTRNKERMALIEKGADATIFFSKKEKTTGIWKVLFLNIALLLMGVGTGIILGQVLYVQLNIEQEVIMPASIFLMAGTGLLVGYFITRKLEKN